ncbi:MAG: FkbM family methyltransferase [Elusimicrobia bacterium]|nr:FkbM family methyltransferase [Elusimicrobiota bacterium]
MRVLADGTELRFHPDDEKIIREIHEDGCYARAEILDGDVVVDVGAHVGVFSIYAARKTPRGRVIAVEPAPTNLEFLRYNVEKNSLRNVKIFDCALSDKAGQAELFFPGDHALYTLKPNAPTAVSHAVRLRTLDDLFEAESITNCKLLKIDAERSEYAVLQGGARALKVVHQLLVEAGKEEATHEKVLAFLRERGFQCSIVLDTPGGIVLYAVRSGETAQKE